MTERTFSNKAPRWAAGSAALLLVLFSVGYADSTYVSGPITRSTTWTRANSPYVVVGNVLVQDTVTLTIEPGVTVAFDSLKALTINGTIIARGTANDSIRLTSRRHPPSPGDWAYIWLDSTSVDAEYDSLGNYLRGCILEYCAIRYAGGAGVTNDAAVRLHDAHPFISHCRIGRNGRGGIGGWGLTGGLRIANCVLDSNAFNGAVWLFGGGWHRISGCTISANDASGGNDGGGIWLIGCGATVTACAVARNHAAGSGGGIWCANGLYTVSGCAIVGNDASGSGGGVDVSTGVTVATIAGDTIVGNAAGDEGGGIWSSADSMAVVNCVIADNTSRRSVNDAGGGIRTMHQYLISNNIITGNAAPYGPGGGVALAAGSNGRISGNVIRGNTTGECGGGIVMSDPCTTTLSGNLISHNSANGSTSGGGGAYLGGNNSGAVVTSNVFSDNTAPSSWDGGLALRCPSPVLGNCLVRNSSPGTSAISYTTGSGEDFGHNTVTGNVSSSTGDAVWVLSHPLVNHNNIFHDSGAYELMNWNDVGTPDVNAESNWWGTRVEGEIQQKIYDWYDDATKGIVDYTPWDTVIRTDCPVSPPTGVQAQAIGDTLVLVTWNANPEPDLEGYIVHWDTTNDTLYPFAHHVDVGRTTTYAIRGLTPDTYFITVTAYDADYDSTRNLPNTVINECQTDGNESWYAEGVYVYVTGVGEAAVVIPRELGLVCVGSNPFRRGTTIRYALPARTQVDLAVYDLSGRKVACLAQGEKQPGRYEARFDASKLPAGVYFCKLRADDCNRTVKLVLQR